MRSKAITLSLLVVAVIHLLPVLGFLGGDQLAALYGIEVNDSNLEILLRHRAMLFGILGVFIGFSAFRPALQPIAFWAAFVSIVSFFYVAFSADSFNDAIRRVVVADVVALLALALAVVLYSRGPVR